MFEQHGDIRQTLDGSHKVCFRAHAHGSVNAKAQNGARENAAKAEGPYQKAGRFANAPLAPLNAVNAQGLTQTQQGEG